MRFLQFPAWSIGNGCALFTAKFSRLRDAFQRDLGAGRQAPGKGIRSRLSGPRGTRFTIAYMLDGVVNFRHREQFGGQRNLAAGGKTHQLTQLIRRAGSRTRCCGRPQLT